MSGRLRGCGVGALPALLLLLLLGPPATTGITCPAPTSVKHADIRVKSYNLNSRERYVCNSGFKRKAGTSSLTECVFNKTVNIAHWTTPNLKCIRDPSLTHQTPPSTAAPTGVTPEPDSPNPSGKEPAFTSKSDTTVATRLATGPGSRLMPSKAPSAGTTGVVNNEPSQVPAQTTANAPEHTPSASQDPPGAYQYNPRTVTGKYSPLSWWCLCSGDLSARVLGGPGLCLLSRHGHQQLPLSLSKVSLFSGHLHVGRHALWSVRGMSSGTLRTLHKVKASLPDTQC
ncbi:interleukin-15 receptor subunit alpha isoform 1-T1 [Megaptera novaeangliae]